MKPPNAFEFIIDEFKKADYDNVSYYHFELVKLSNDTKIFKKGETVSKIIIDFDYCTIEIYDYPSNKFEEIDFTIEIG